MAVLSALLTALAALLLVTPPAGRSAAAGRAPRRPDGPRASKRLLLQFVAAGGAALAVLLALPGPLAWASAPVIGLVVWRRSSRWEGAADRRRRSVLDRELPHVVDLMVAVLSAGAAPAEALARVAGVVEPAAGEELAVWVARLRLGADPITVWSAMARHDQFGRLGTALRRSAESGAPVAAALTRLAEDLRARRRADVEARARQVEVKAAVPLGVCLLPAFVLVGVVPLVAGSVTGLLGVR